MLQSMTNDAFDVLYDAKDADCKANYIETSHRAVYVCI